ncbi:MAG: hypothetical protein ACRD94_06175 [Nitrosopumilaceae archaeon]
MISISTSYAEETSISSWVEQITLWYKQHKISESEFHNAFDFLIEKEIIKSNSSKSTKELIYGISDKEKNWNIVRSTLDGATKEVITSFNLTSLEGVRPLHAIDLKLSPDGKFFLYVFSKDSKSLWIVDTETKVKQLVVKAEDNQRLSQYFWSPDSKKISYSLEDIPPPCDNCGMPAYFISGTYYFYDIENQKTQIIREPTRGIGLGGWWDNEHLVFSEFEWHYVKIPFHLYNINSKESIFLTEVDYFPSLVINQNNNHMIVLNPSITNKCEILIINTEAKKESRIQLDDPCPTNYNQDFSLSQDGFNLIYGKVQAPFGGEITTAVADKNGVYVIPSIYSLNLKTKIEHPILLGKPNEKYIMFGSWNEESDALAYLDWHIEPEEERFSMMISKSDASKAIEIAKIERGRQEHWQEITFYGWKSSQ